MCKLQYEAATTVAVHCSLYWFISAGHTYPAPVAKYTFESSHVKQQKAMKGYLSAVTRKSFQSDVKGRFMKVAQKKFIV